MYLRLNQVNHCVLVPAGGSFDGMLQKVKDFVTWGEIKPDVLTNLILKRGRLEGERPITNQYVIDNTKHASLLKLSEAIVAGQFRYGDLKGVKPVFRLHPPLKGLESVKRPYSDKGSLGNRGEAINDLIMKMLVGQAPDAKKAKRAEAPKASGKAAEPETARQAPAMKKAEAAEQKAPAEAPAKKKAAPKPKEE
jgi:large subunit ribosomal protein L30